MLAFNPDGTRLATIVSTATSIASISKGPGEVVVWDIPGGQELFRLKGLFNGLEAVAYSPDGKRIATCSAGRSDTERQVRLWDAATGAELLNLVAFQDNFIDRFADYKLSFNPDGTRLALDALHSPGGLLPGRRLRVWDATPLPEKR